MDFVLSHLPPTIREVFEYRFFSSPRLMPQKEIASKMGVARSSVSNYLSRGFAALREAELNIDGQTAAQWKSVLIHEDPITYAKHLPALNEACHSQAQFMEFLSSWVDWPEEHFARRVSPPPGATEALLKALGRNHLLPRSGNKDELAEWLIEYGRLLPGEAKQWARYAINSALIPLGRKSSLPLDIFMSQALLSASGPLSKDELCRALEGMGSPYQGQNDRLPRVREESCFVLLSTKEIAHKSFVQKEWFFCQSTSESVKAVVESAPEEVFLLRQLWADHCPLIDYGIFRSYWKTNKPANWKVHWRSLSDKVSLNADPKSVGWPYFASKAATNGRVDVRQWTRTLKVCHRHVMENLNNDRHWTSDWSKEGSSVYKSTKQKKRQRNINKSD